MDHLREETRNTAGVTAGGLLRPLVLITILATYGLIALGGVVRATGSGDACPDWPRCHGELIPPMEPDVLIEFSHRLVASGLGFLVLGVAIAAWRGYRHNHAVVMTAGAALALLVGQVILGGVTVLSDLPASLVMAHLSVAAMLLAALILLAVLLSPVPKADAERRRGAAGFRTTAAVAMVATFVLMLTGSYVSGSGAGLAFRDWPLFDGELWPDGGRLEMIHALHRVVAGLVGLYLLHLTAKAWRRMAWHRPVALASTGIAALVLGQMLVGASNVWSDLQPAARAAHLALAMAIWALAALTAFLSFRVVAMAEGPLLRAIARGALPEAATGGPR